MLCAAHLQLRLLGGSDLALEDESIYNYLQVEDDDHTTTLSTNVLFGVQSVQNKDGKLTGMYYDYALAAPVWRVWTVPITQAAAP